MQGTSAYFMVIAGLIPLGGCGTMMNMSDMERVDWAASAVHTTSYVPKYRQPAFPLGGIANDIAWLKTSEGPIDIVASAADMPFSLVGDVVTLPWSLQSWLSSAQNRDEAILNADKSQSSSFPP